MTLHSAHTMSSERFHKAAKDGALDILKEATRKDANTKDGDGMTPVLWAAFEGRLDALRLLAGKGGDPDKCDQFGNTALHLSSAKGHIHCVDFLLKFGVNIYALDIDRHSAKDLAAINNRDDVLRYLDSAIANLETIDRRKAKSMKEIAEKNCEKRIKDYVKRQQRIEHDYENMKSSSHRSGSMLSALKHKIWSSQGNLNKATKDSGSTANNDKLKDVVVGGSVANRGGVVQKKAISSKLKHQMHEKDRNDDHSFLDIDNKLCLSSLNRLHRDTEALYMGTFSSNEDSGSRAKITDIFDAELNSDTEKDRNRFCYGALSRSFSQPDFLAAQQDEEGSNISVPQRQSGLFDRPMLGSVAFRQSVTAALNQLHPEASSIDSSNSANTSRKIGSMTKSRSKSRSFLDISDTDSEGASFSDDEDQEDSGSPIQRFLAVWCLEEYLAVFHKQQIDLDTLMLLTEADLKSLGLPLGPFRKLTFAIQERRNALSNPGPIQDSRL